MGLRHRTAVSMIRMQRQKAEASGTRVTGKTPSRPARNVSFSQIDPAVAQRRTNLSTPLHRHDQEDSLRLLQRLREALQPWTNEQSKASKEYESLQDELMRLSQHIAQQKSQMTAEIWDDQTVPYRYATDEGPDSLPYRTIRIVTSESHPIERLDVTPMDLSRYRQVIQETPAPTRNLTLVSADKAPVPEAKDLLIDEEVQLGQATANLTQESLQARGPGNARTAISPKVALSLLDT
jgi:hypothetical protein